MITSSHMLQLASAQLLLSGLSAVMLLRSSFWLGLALLSGKTLKRIGSHFFSTGSLPKQPSGPLAAHTLTSLAEDYETDTGCEESVKTLGSVWLCINSRYEPMLSEPVGTRQMWKLCLIGSLTPGTKCVVHI